MPVRTYRLSETCFCGQPADGHPRCEACLILTGPQHYDVNLLGGLCGMCRQRDNLFIPSDGEIEKRRKRAQALDIFEERGHIRAVMSAFRLSRKHAIRWVERAQREREGLPVRA